MRLVLTGGGTAGHAIPNMAVIEELKARGFDGELLYIGSAGSIEEKLIGGMGVRFEAVKCGKLRRYFSWENFKDFFKVPVGVFQARKVLKDFKADLVFSKGGYVALPVVLAAAWLGMKIFAHESDIRPGLANRIAMRYADKILLSYEESRSYIPSKYIEKVVLTGNPVRKSILEGEAEAGYKLCGFDKFRPVILVMGGSQGAAQINRLIRASLDDLLKRFQIVHICGRGNIDIGAGRKGYKQFEFLDKEMKDVYAICEMVLSRGGANSLIEIAVLHKKALILPLGLHGSRGDQIENAKLFCGKIGWGMLSGEVSREQFIEAIEMSYKNELNFDSEFGNGVESIANLILDYSK